MPAYVAFLVDIHDAAGFSAYARAAGPTYANYGGKIILRGPIVSVLEGDLRREEDTRLVVIEFPSAAKAQAWWQSGEYQRTVQLRQPPVSTARAFLVDGVDLSVHGPS